MHLRKWLRRRPSVVDMRTAYVVESKSQLLRVFYCDAAGEEITSGVVRMDGKARHHQADEE